jgi:glutamate dehydrogenase (NAD(P)+)
MLDEFERIRGGRFPGFITGKPVGMGGSLGRTEATGYGVMFTVREAMKELGIDVRKTIGAFQGFGNVSQYAVRLFKEYGGTPICVACWDQADLTSYTFRRMSGIDPGELVGMTDKFGTIDKDKAKKAGYEVLPGDAWIEQEADLLVPAALENQVTAANAPKIHKRVKLIAEGANGPTAMEADAVIRDRGIFMIPDFLCNAGGVTCSYFEQVQSNMNHYWSREEVLSQLDHKMTAGFKAVSDLARKKNVTMRDAAYMIAISRVAEACRLRGWI